MKYFGAGLWHFAAAMAFAAAVGVLSAGDVLFWLRDPFFSFPLLVSSSALFFVPEKWAKKGLLKFLHYPLPDWDVLLLGPASHRNWLTHSSVLPAATLALAIHFPGVTKFSAFMSMSAGLCVGVGSHLFWDCVGSNSHKIVVVPYWFALRSAPSRVYLLAGAALSLAAALYFCGLLPMLI
ncbi:MAG: hypothetical protein JWN98_2301 [Abditibacteriota bacterium]|nr:hypothetical protein [Abditibacteriota bacterium]